MKVDVLTVEDVKIERLRWWSNWIDVSIFSFGGQGYLLQMKISRHNSKKFKCVPFRKRYTFEAAYASMGEVGDLTQMAKI